MLGKADIKMVENISCISVKSNATDFRSVAFDHIVSFSFTILFFRLINRVQPYVLQLRFRPDQG